MQIRRAEPLKSLNTLALDARATALARVSSTSELLEALDWARGEGLPLLPLGDGSNIVFAGEVEAVLLQQAPAGWEVLEAEKQYVRLRVSAGENWHRLVEQTLAEGWYGLENLALIPGRVGAAPIQNIGAYGVEFERFLEAVHGIDLDSGQPVQLSAPDCRFGYRDSVFKHQLRDRVAITAVDIRLQTVAAVDCSYPALAAELERLECRAPTPQDVFAAVVAVRRRRLPDPAREPNAGSFFKNPVLGSAEVERLRALHPALPVYPQPDGTAKIPAAWLIERAGWKGRREGAFGTHPEHALVMVHYGAGQGAALLQLAAQVVQSVSEQFGITLEMEPRIYGQP